MKTEQQRIAIAEACGYTNVRWFAGRLEGEFNGRLIISLPDYLTDLNAMHETEKVLTHEQRRAFIVQLIMAVGPSARKESPCDWENGWHEIHATAAQRAEAFLRTIGKVEASA